MVGNDIVDLEEAKRASNWERPRFLNKIFTSQEQYLIRNSKNPFVLVWQLWSMKEAAYKLYTQQNPSRFYNPKGFKCNIQNKNSSVKFKVFNCFVNTLITSKYILSEARLIPFKMTSRVIKIEDNNQKNQSEATRNALLIELSKRYQVSKKELKLQKSVFGIPCVQMGLENIQVSLSHHGSFGVYAMSS